MGQLLVTPAVSGALIIGSVAGDTGLDWAYVGIAGTTVMLLLCLGSFVRQRWAGLLFWAGAALGALLGQAYAVWDHESAAAASGGSTSWGEVDASWFGFVTSSAIGAVLGMLGGGMLADWWQARQVARSGHPWEAVEADEAGPHDPAAPTRAAGSQDLSANDWHDDVERRGVSADYVEIEAEAV